MEESTRKQQRARKIAMAEKVRVEKAQSIKREKELAIARDIMRVRKVEALKRKLNKRTPSSMDPYAMRASEFEKSLKESEMSNKRHSDERNALIDELESYNKTYKKQY